MEQHTSRNVGVEKSMKISSRGEYALRALIYLGKNQNGVKSISDIAEETLVTEQYLEQIMLQLKGFGYVESRRGIKGGYKLKSPPEKINIGEVVRKIEGPLAPMSCVSVTAYEACPLEESCSLKPLWALIRDNISNLLEQISLNDLIDGVEITVLK